MLTGTNAHLQSLERSVSRPPVPSTGGGQTDSTASSCSTLHRCIHALEADLRTGQVCIL